jgi:hypothetical protein
MLVFASVKSGWQASAGIREDQGDKIGRIFANTYICRLLTLGVF